MKSIVCVSLIVLLGTIAGCDQTGTEVDAIDNSFPEEQEKIKILLDDIFTAAKAKKMDSLEAFHLAGPKFSKFDDGEISGRQDYEMGKKTENDFFMGVAEFDYKLPDTKVDVFDDAAIASFIIDYSVKIGDSTINGQSRGTLVFVKDRHQWKITHEHFSPVTQPL